MNNGMNLERNGFFYHITLAARIESVLERGLLPARDAAELGFEQPYPSDPAYVYLFNTTRMQRNILMAGVEWMAGREVLRVMLPESHPIEREYDQAQIALRLSGEALDWFLRGRAHPDEPLRTTDEYVKFYFKNVHGLDYDCKMTLTHVRHFIDAHISDAEWAERDGCYRTPEKIPPSCVSVVTKEEILG